MTLLAQVMVLMVVLVVVLVHVVVKAQLPMMMTHRTRTSRRTFTSSKLMKIFHR